MFTKVGNGSFSAGSVDRRVLSSPPAVGPWVRNPSWPALTTPAPTDETFVALYAVWPYNANFCAAQLGTSSGNYIIDWGDGTSDINASGVTALKNYDYNSASLTGTDAPATLNSATSTVDRTAHGYTDGMNVTLYNLGSGAGPVNTQTYFVVNATANTFQISLTKGGSPVTITSTVTCTLLPYKIAQITVTPQTGGTLLRTVNLNVTHTQSGLQTGYTTGWLEMKLAHTGGSAPPVAFSGTSSPSRMLEHVEVVNTNATSLAGACSGATGLRRFVVTSAPLVTNVATLFVNCSELTEVVLNLGALSSCDLMFQNCRSLVEAPMLNTASVFSFANMFNACTALTTVPLYNLAGANDVTSMFSGCTSIKTVPLFNTSAVTTITSMFQSCASLEELPLFNFSSVTAGLSVFQGCTALKTVPLFDTSGVANFTSWFNGCFSLETVPLFDTSSATTMQQMFTSCTSLKSVPLFDTSSLLTATNMFSSCTSLVDVPLFNTALVTNMQSMFTGCTSLTTVPLFNTAAVTTMQLMFNGCTSLTSVPAFVTTAVTTANSMFSGCSSLRQVPAFNFTGITAAAGATSLYNNCRISSILASNLRFTHTVASNILSGTALDEYYTRLPTITGQTLTVTGNFGTTTDTPSIATGKGWTVTGS